MASACVPVNIAFIQGKLLLVRHLPGAPEGEGKWRINSRAVESFALGAEVGINCATNSGQVILKMPMDDPAVDNATALDGGNTVVPRSEGARKR